MAAFNWIHGAEWNGLFERNFDSASLQIFFNPRVLMRKYCIFNTVGLKVTECQYQSNVHRTSVSI